MNIAASKYIIRNWNILSAARPGKGCYPSYCIPHLAWGLTHNAYSTNVCTIEHVSVTFSDDSLFQGRRTLLQKEWHVSLRQFEQDTLPICVPNPPFGFLYVTENLLCHYCLIIIEPLIQARNSSLPTVLSTSECVSNSNQLLFLFSHFGICLGSWELLSNKISNICDEGCTWGEVGGQTDFLPGQALFFHRDCSGIVTCKASSDFSNVFLSLPTLPFSLRGKK